MIKTSLFLQNTLSVVISGVLSSSLSLILNSYSSYHFNPNNFLFYYFCPLFFAFNLIYTFTAYSTAFTEIILTGLIVKLLISLAVVAIYSFSNSANFFNFSLHFILHYILFTVFGIAYLLRLIKRKQIKT